ncbi:vascular endothelial growth factor receptor 1-like isoform X1 [Anopheles darlingi]|uniref:vascular endothelial growth factor receptor 1-like isoform X1 n=1 Tax=Anopheles darlingi TaxID=43151 RepID=UPI0021004037|nr:vascular endothelial growth factor receptor 1-like isoform X1 [Anopheles darlingi]XP_049549456.1 vascular endothelial growth factor receptor 1-like isoform X1 [Anopheles darlingi]XP_049549457.1 vascular endothelial growth factor receptor 1-like isoform X1 [Anopheles darlingi]XP_049549458.1 vascular endothelial growth factor receptor 1-like isoform X1 [Anopheles darlingi]XP_049549459.1 vascular endothelial growth factor receptor 1-like isoform X1 [Anopheles darlingi]XP_049549460.1 vascular e
MMGRTATVILVFTSIVILSVFRQASFVTAEEDELYPEDHADSIAHDAPEIDTSGEQVVLEFGVSWNVTCKSSSPIMWIPYETSYHWVPPDVTTIDFRTEDPDKPYGTMLMIKSASAAVVGRYYCVNRSMYDEDNEDELDELVVADHASTLYVYVDDKEQPLVPVNVPAFRVNQYDAFVIPCKPSHPATEVELHKDMDGELVEEYLFSSTQGYKLHFNRLEDGGSYYCRQRGNNAHLIEFGITVNEHYDSEEAAAEYLPKPTIESDTSDHVPLGKPIRLVCTVDIRAGVLLSMEWKVPPNNQNAAMNSRIKLGHLILKQHPERPHREIATQMLTIDAATLEDKGTYRCEVSNDKGHTNYHNFKLHVRETSDDYVMLTEENRLTAINAKRPTEGIAKPIEIVIHYRSYPRNITAYWTKDNDKELTETTHDSKYQIFKTDKYLKLTINDPTVYDTGMYTVMATAGSTHSLYNMPVYVHEKPIAHLDEPKFVKPGETVDFMCRSIGYPVPVISFMFKPCLEEPWRNCSRMASSASAKWDSSSPDIVSEHTPRTTARSEKETSIASSRTYRIIANQPGIVYCKATNTEGSETLQTDLLVSGLPEPIVMERVHPKEIVTVGDTVTYVCSALVYNYTKEIIFTHNGKELHEHDGVVVTYSAKSFAWEARLTIDNVAREQSGEISCYVKTIDGATESNTTYMDVLVPVAPKLLSESEEQSMTVDTTSIIVFDCDVIGTPEPEITWFKDNMPLEIEKNNSRIHLTRTVLTYEYMKPDELGLYECRAENKEGKIIKSWNVDVRTAVVKKTLIYAIVALLLLLIIAIVLISLFYCKKKKEVKAMKAAGLANFEEGNLGCYNPDVALDEQADLLPYNSEYEFPRDRLKLGKQLGTGAFGVVMKATATGIMVNEDETIVAVKMVKKQTDNEVMRALISELKIMVHLGQHLNVVNLLGAVTKNIAKRELMVIVEYCPFGNVQNFLLKSRPHFIDQINQETGEIDPTIEKNELRWSKCGYQYNSQGLKYINLSFSTNNINHHPLQHPTAFYHNHISGTTQPYADPKKQLNSKGYMRHSGMQNMGMIDSCNTEATALTSIEVEDLNSINSNEPLWRTSYRMDFKGPVRTVNTTDLVCWASQIAAGMEYLASRKVLHGDLAARNILLCEDNVVKICDFGLARSMYKSDNYKKKGEAPLPFKWLALECISDNVFSTYSDVWAYGIVLWELFSLGKVPYPGMEANQELYNKLRDGYRMDKPQFSNQDIYDIMLNCWNVKPDSRPTFQDLKSRFNAMLPDEMRDHYMELNEPYLAMNAEKIERGETDYLANLGPPEELAPSAPNYVNGIILPLPPISEIRKDKDYLKMSGAKSDSDDSQFDFANFSSERHSPTIRNNLDTSPPNGSKRHKKKGLPEEIPMLDTNRLSAVANGFYSDGEQEAISPKPRERTSKHNPEPEYINLKTSKGPAMRGVGSKDELSSASQDAISNPGYIALSTVDEKRC